MAACNVQTLLQEACDSGFRCLDEGQYRAVMLQLLCELNAAVTAAGNGLQYVEYTVAPPANPADTSKAAIAFDPTGILPTLFWNKNTQTWN